MAPVEIKNKALYADAGKYCPLVVRFQVMTSSLLMDRSKFCSRIFRFTNFSKWAKENSTINLIFATHAFPCEALLMVHLFYWRSCSFAGAMSLGFAPLSHGASKDGIFPLLPTKIVVVA
jgi:hypothetical protein